MFFREHQHTALPGWSLMAANTCWKGNFTECNVHVSVEEKTADWHTKLLPNSNGRLQATVMQYWLLDGSDHKRKILPSLCKTTCHDIPASNVLRTSVDNVHHCQPLSLECHCPGWKKLQQQKIPAYAPIFTSTAWQLRDPPHQWDTQTWASRKLQWKTSQRSTSGKRSGSPPTHTLWYISGANLRAVSMKRQWRPVLSV